MAETQAQGSINPKQGGKSSNKQDNRVTPKKSAEKPSASQPDPLAPTEPTSVVDVVDVTTLDSQGECKECELNTRSYKINYKVLLVLISALIDSLRVDITTHEHCLDIVPILPKRAQNILDGDGGVGDVLLNANFFMCGQPSGIILQGIQM